MNNLAQKMMLFGQIAKELNKNLQILTRSNGNPYQKTDGPCGNYFCGTTEKHIHGENCTHGCTCQNKTGE